MKERGREERGGEGEGEIKRERERDKGIKEIGNGKKEEEMTERYDRNNQGKNSMDMGVYKLWLNRKMIQEQEEEGGENVEFIKKSKH